MSQSIFITGSSTGFGRQSAITLAAKGYTIFATMRGVEGKNKENADALRQEASDNGWNLHVLELDVTDEASAEAAAKQAHDIAGSIDVLVNNAGVGSFGMVETVTIEQAKSLFEVNVIGVLRVNRAILPYMRSKGAGYVVYISSGVGRLLLGVYSASKFALEAIAETASYELAPLGIETSIIQPGAYGTDFAANMVPAGDQERFNNYGVTTEMAGQFMADFSNMEFGDPQEVTDALVTLVESPAGQRPLRQPVGQDMQMLVEQVNAATAQAQNQLMQAMGMA